MTKTGYILVGLGITTLALGTSYLLRVKRLSDELETVIKATIYKVTLTSLEIRIVVTLKNPTGGTVTIKYPFVKLTYKGETVATSQVKNQDVKIPTYSELQLDPIMINIPILTLALKSPALLKEYRANGTLPVQAETISTINGKLPYKKVEDLFPASPAAKQ